jgi:hypothetical protein
MNQKDTLIAQRETLNRYHTPGCTDYNKRPINAIFLNPTNSEKHEMAKCAYCYELLKAGRKFITEAVNNNTGERNDVVILDTGEKIEFEMNPKRAERFKGRADIIVKKLWEESGGQGPDTDRVATPLHSSVELPRGATGIMPVPFMRSAGKPGSNPGPSIGG